MTSSYRPQLLDCGLHKYRHIDTWIFVHVPVFYFSVIPYSIKIIGSWVLTPCSLMVTYQTFRLTASYLTRVETVQATCSCKSLIQVYQFSRRQIRENLWLEYSLLGFEVYQSKEQW